MATEVRLIRFDYRPAVEREIANDRAVGSELLERADTAASVARSVAPVRTGAYRASISSGLERSGNGYEAKVQATAPYARFVEFGTSDTPRFAPIRHGIEAISRGVI